MAFSLKSPDLKVSIWVSFSSFRIPNCEVFEPCRRVIPQCWLCVDRASSLRILEKCLNRPPFFVCKVCCSLLLLFSCLLIQPHQASSFCWKPSKISSKDHLGKTPLFNSLCSICRSSLGSMCRLLTFMRIHRLLTAKRATLVFCGFTADSLIGKALRGVEVLGVKGVELFGTFNDTMECEFLLRLAIGEVTNGMLGTENASWFRSQKIETSPMSLCRF